MSNPITGHMNLQLALRIVVHGRPAHVGLHFRGVNAFRGMLTVAEMFRALEEEVSTRLTRFAARPEAARRSVLLLGGEMSGGHNFNVVPDRVSFTLDRRTNPDEDFDAERAETDDRQREPDRCCDSRNGDGELLQPQFLLHELRPRRLA